MSNICRFTATASRDIETIIDLIADKSSFDAAEHLLKKVNQKCKNLAIFPNMGRRRDELLQELRSFPVDDYLIFYRPIEGGIEILRVISGYRDLEAVSIIAIKVSAQTGKIGLSTTGSDHKTCCTCSISNPSQSSRFWNFSQFP